MPVGKKTLFYGASGTQSERVWLEWRSGDLLVSSEQYGTAEAAFYGEDEIDTFITVKAAQMPRLARALGCRQTPRSITAALVERYSDDDAATAHLMELLAEHAIPYDFYSI
jgi:hypothetical protein